MKIGELAKRSGMAASRIRFYESNGLISAVKRKANGYREYGAEAIYILDMITCGQQAGFSLEELRQLLPKGESGWKHGELLEALKRKVSDIEALEGRLAETKQHLLRAIAQIEHKPPDIDCEDNARQILENIQIKAV